MKKEVVKFLILLLVAMGAGPATGAFWQWEMTPSANGSADPSINWVEGQPPSVVNDSARAMMARLAEQAVDTSGMLVTTGGPTAYVVATNQGYPNPPKDGQLIGVTFNVASTGSPTLAVDSGTAYPILSAPSVPSSVAANVPYTLMYNMARSSWLMRSALTAGTGITLVNGVIASTPINAASFQASSSGVTGKGGAETMSGFGTACNITPTYSGRIFVSFTTYTANNTVGDTTIIRMRYGSGTAPVNGAVVTGTQPANAETQNTAAGINYNSAANVSAVITGLTKGTAYWLDLSAVTNGGSGSIGITGCSGLEF